MGEVCDILVSIGYSLFMEQNGNIVKASKGEAYANNRGE